MPPTSLTCEINTLAYPKAAVFAFALATVAYNAVSILKSLPGAVHGSEAIDVSLSWHYLCDEVSSTWAGFEIATPPARWNAAIGAFDIGAFTRLLLSFCWQLPLSRYPKSHRGPKKHTLKGMAFALLFLLATRCCSKT